MKEEEKLENVLFPKAVDFNNNIQNSNLIEQYKIFVESSERLVARRQTINTFFLTLNSLLLTGLGLTLREIINMQGWLVLVVVPIGAAGILICILWRRLVLSYKQLNTCKFNIIDILENYLPASLFKAEWVALGEGKDDKKYRPSTKIEMAIPIVFIVVYFLFIATSIILFSINYFK